LRTPRIDSALSTAHSQITRGTSAAANVLRGHNKAVACLGIAAGVAAGAGAAGAAAVSGPAASLPPALHAPSGSIVAGTAPGPVSGLPSQTRDSLTTPVNLASANRAAIAAISTGRTPAQAGTPALPGAAAGPPGAATPASPPPAAPGSAPPAAPGRPSLNAWSDIEDAAANQGANSPVSTTYNPLPIGVAVPQSQLPMNGVQWQNAATIVQQALAKGMGLRSAVIAVATAMQESKLININYGTYDSLGLFQQRPSSGWGSAAQVTNPAYAADAFLDALHDYQLQNPGWATQPVWQPAQGVQNSAYPTAYGQWEVQAAQIVMGCARNLL
jgi:hypothetical protein